MKTLFAYVNFYLRIEEFRFNQRTMGGYIFSDVYKKKENQRIRVECMDKKIRYVKRKNIHTIIPLH